MFINNVSLASARSFWHDVKADPLWLGWNIGALVSFGLPLMVMTIARLVGGADEEEEQQDNNNQDDAYNYNNNNNNNNGNHWWNQWSNNNSYNNNNQNGSQDEAATPWWWFWGEEGGGSPDAARQGSLRFAHVWSIGVFVALVVYGNYVFRKQLRLASTGNTSPTAQLQTAASLGMLQGALVIFLNLAFLTLILIAGLGEAIEMDGPEVEENGGWYGQLGVCVFLTNLSWLVWGGVFLYLLKRRHTTAVDEDVSTSYVRQDSDSEGPKKLEMV